MSTKRNDEFALEVYETSLYLAVLFSSPVQATSIISQLLPNMYLTHLDRQRRSQPIVMLSCLHFLCTAYPSQSRFFEHLTSLPRDLISESTDTRRWLWDLARALRQRNFARLDQLTTWDAFSSFVASTPVRSAPSQNTSGAPENLAMEVLATLVDTLRVKARDTAWSVLRSAYRELSCPKFDVNQGAKEPSTTVWLRRSLLLKPVILSGDDLDELSLVDRWLAAKEADGSIRPKEGLEGRWLISKLK
ncbi:hypothetical protein EIP86_006497 [Pleurotus ostreatoroseus]|nr:hypothetical protein EIP86_006497 [Pleurotus ostreatoroseus]